MNVWSDNAGNVFSSGYFVGLVDFDLATSTTNTITNSSTTLPSLYLAKYSSSGTFISANKLTNPGVKSMQSHVDANGDLLFCGNQYGGINVDPTGTFHTYCLSLTYVEIFTMRWPLNTRAAFCQLSIQSAPLQLDYVQDNR